MLRATNRLILLAAFYFKHEECISQVTIASKPNDDGPGQEGALMRALKGGNEDIAAEILDGTRFEPDIGINGRDKSAVLSSA